MNSLTAQHTKEMFIYVGERIIESKPLLTELDSAIGDGDHGTGMALGFSTASKNLNEKEWSTINEIFKTIGMSMITTMGGASGVIFGTMFIGGVKNESTIEELTLVRLASIMQNSLQAVKDRGKASLGDKTMIDALEPAVVALMEASNNSTSLLDGLRAAEERAKDGVENTKNYISKFGRSKTLGERSIGYQDAGATSVWIIFRSMREWLENAS
ncbi:dihydroxyacetone kinase subunit DhaL [Bacillus sp. Marseille-P3661]|uniref:dihydroxyacetone kinase subunit DhaL n=1 Tax=Bacillus sp. Marseille-P3661 TaxID=1936234 RepID=UPI0015E199B7|nr:dihydroxyacetone kinase subunit DhaL [Bacillus sp. Marseille-P3661]